MLTRRKALLGTALLAGLGGSCLFQNAEIERHSEGSQSALSDEPYSADQTVDLLQATQVLVGDTPSGRPLISNANSTVYVDPKSGDDTAPGTESEPLRTIQEAVDRIPLYLRHQYTIDLVTVPETPVEYDEDVLVSSFIGTGQAGQEDGAPEPGPIFNVEIIGDSNDTGAVSIGSLMFANVVGASAAILKFVTITRDSPYDDESHGLSSYGTGEVHLYDIQFDGPTNGVLAYGSKMKASLVDFGNNGIEIGLHAKRHGSVVSRELDGVTTWAGINSTQNSIITIIRGNRLDGDPIYRTLTGGLIYNQEMSQWVGLGTDTFTAQGNTEQSGANFSESGNVKDAGVGTIWYADGSGELEEGFYGQTSDGPIQLG